MDKTDMRTLYTIDIDVTSIEGYLARKLDEGNISLAYSNGKNIYIETELGKQTYRWNEKIKKWYPTKFVRPLSILTISPYFGNKWYLADFPNPKLNISSRDEQFSIARKLGSPPKKKENMTDTNNMDITKDICSRAEKIFKYATQFVDEQFPVARNWGGIQKGEITFTAKGINYNYEDPHDQGGSFAGSSDVHMLYTYKQFFVWLEKKEKKL